MAFPHSSQEELALPTASQKLVKLEAGSSDISISSSQKPRKEASKPNKARRAFRHTQLAANQFLRRRRRATGPRNERLPLSAVELILQNLDIRGAAREDKQNATDRPPMRPCPHSANELHDRLELSRSVVRCVLGRGTTARPTRYVTSEELPRLLAPVLADMRACLGYVAAFRSLLDLETEGFDQWLDLSHLRQCVFRLMGYWPHDISHDLGAWSFGLPNDLARLLYPQCGRFDHREMAMNLDGIWGLDGTR